MEIIYTKDEILGSIKTVERQLKFNRELLLETGNDSYRAEILAKSEQLKFLNQLLVDNVDAEVIAV